ncbi:MULTISPECIES: glycosyltransferase [Nocardioides]|uniref:Glycosyltransferase n=2 Tax=Nocardioides kribbensis TaxID=305517 RepID=A0ABV1NXP1_9ACTN|nr:glycosyltransferase [Nocardioides sp. P86]MCM3517135.1 glycosyltransferase [Nocardioides sp. P86]
MSTIDLKDDPRIAASVAPRRGQGPAVRPTTSVVVPTYNEQDNVVPLVLALQEVLGRDGRHEVVFVDDSDDATPDVVRAVSREVDLPVRLVHRAVGQRQGGLGGAVIAGIRASSAETVVVMDGDLQHPPATVPLLVAALRGHDVAVASRYCEDGGADGLAGGLRHAVSRASTWSAKALFPRRLRDCTDPMTGFFAVRRSALDVDRLEPMGFKILLEILARHPLRVTEVPFEFGERHAGESKADLRQGLLFVRQLLNLRAGRMVRFGLVGLTGLAVNLACMALLLAVGVHYLPASVLATEVAIVSNFLLQERFVFGDRRGSSSRRRRAWQAVLFNNVEQLVRLPLLVLAVGVLGAGELASQAGLIVLAFAGRYAFMSRVVYPQRASGVLVVLRRRSGRRPVAAPVDELVG